MKKLLFYSSISILFLVACKKEIESTESTSNAVVTLNPSGYDQNRITYFWDEIQPYQKSVNDGITFYHAADVSSPIINGNICSATGIDISGNFCYVTYHVAGGQYGGALEVFDISSPANPILVSQMLFNDTDLNECFVKNGKLYAVGGRDIYSSDFTANSTKGAILVEIALSNNLLTNNLRWVPLPSYSGNSVNVAGDYIYVVTGSTGGGVFTLNANTLDLVQSDYIDNAKFCDIKNNMPGNPMLVLQGNPNAVIHAYTAGPSNIAGKTTYQILSQSVPENGKAVLHIDNNDVYVCTGSNGLMAYNLLNLAGAPSINFNSPGDGTSNGVDSDGQFVYIANGTEGNIILNKDDHSIHTIFPFSGSANYVRANSNYVFIANGKGGLKILKRVNPIISSGPACGNRPTLTPSVINQGYTINPNQSFAYQGSNQFKNNFVNNGIFYYCGSMLLKNNMVMNNNSKTEVEGSITVNGNVQLNPGSKLRLHGSITISGNLHLAGAIEFIGTGNTVVINGNVNSTTGFSVTGNYSSNVPLQ